MKIILGLFLCLRTTLVIFAILLLCKTAEYSQTTQNTNSDNTRSYISSDNDNISWELGEEKKTENFLEPKDWVTISVSIIALVFSTASFFQKSAESKLAVRKQLTELLEKLSELNIETQKFIHLGNKESGLPPQYDRLMNDQRRFIVRQAAFTSSKIKDIVSPYEYLVIAGGLDQINDLHQAEKFYLLACKTNEIVDRGIALRGYARFLFNRYRPDEARKNYKETIDLLKGDLDYLRSYRGDTYERWAAQEKEWNNEKEHRELIELALREYESLNNPGWRKSEIERLKTSSPKFRKTAKSVKQPNKNEPE